MVNKSCEVCRVRVEIVMINGEYRINNHNVPGAAWKCEGSWRKINQNNIKLTELRKCRKV